MGGSGIRHQPSMTSGSKHKSRYIKQRLFRIHDSDGDKDYVVKKPENVAGSCMDGPMGRLDWIAAL